MTSCVTPRLLGCIALLGILCLPLTAMAQDSDATSPGLSTQTAIDARRDEIWNSPEMVEARAHLALTFKRSAKITDEQADKYMANLKAMSPDDMQVWLLQYQEQRAQVQGEEARAAGARRDAVRGNIPAQNLGAFRNPVAASGRPVGNLQRPAATHGGAQQTQKPFSGAQFSGAAQPLVTSQDMARFEILRGSRPW